MTGAGGFVGLHLRAALSAVDPPPDLFDVSLEAKDRVAVKLDITSRWAVDALLAEVRPDAVVHLAGQAAVGEAEAGGAAQTYAVNLGGTLNLALAVARHVPEATLLFASSSQVYGHAFGGAPLDEDAVPRPANAYGRSKLMAEEVLAAVLPGTVRLVVARAFNHTGPGQREHFVLPAFAGQVARIEAGLQPPVLRVGNLDAARDFLDVRDVVAAYAALLAAAPRLPPRFTCNVATGAARSLRDVLDAFRRLARVPFATEIDPARLRPSDIPYAAGRAGRLTAATGWTPTVSFDEMLAGVLGDARARVGTRTVEG